MSAADRDVLTSLPRRRPTRRSGKRAPAGDAAAAAGEVPARGKEAAVRAAAGGAAKGSGSTGGKAAAKGAAKRTAKAGGATRAKAAGAGKRAGAAKATGATKAEEPAKAARSVKADSAAKDAGTSAAIPPAGWATPSDPAAGGPGRPDLLTGTARAAGEIARVGVEAGARALRGLLSRLPRP